VGLAVDLDDYVLLHCRLGHLTCKIVSEMTYNVSSGTLNPTLPYNTINGHSGASCLALVSFGGVNLSELNICTHPRQVRGRRTR